MEEISNAIQKLIRERHGSVDIDDAIFTVAQRMRISPQQVHYGLTLGMGEGDFQLSSDGSLLVS